MWRPALPPSSVDCVRMRVSIAVLACLAGLSCAACSDRVGPDDAPFMATTANIPAAPPGARGVVFESPKSLSAGATGPAVPHPNPKAPLLDPDAPDPAFPELEDDTADPFQTAPVPTPAPPKTPKPNPGATVVGPLPKGVQL